MQQVPYICTVMKKAFHRHAGVLAGMLALALSAQPTFASPSGPELKPAPSTSEAPAKKRFFKEPGEPGTLEYAIRQDQQCMLTLAYASGPRGRFDWADKGELRTWADQCVGFQSGAGAHVLQTRSKRGEPFEPQSETGQNVLELFKATTVAWTNSALRHCQKARVQSVQECRAFLDELIRKDKADEELQAN